ncbi:MAG: helix-turn-helix domain-containing protein [Actinophytocola sp.]|uniref:helix-turn-helix transcriptional regulator n=1 Tax=Actinophytocola sp. TaxID=1872138 RepID=UPI00132C66F5|nr:helix-turn-helix transcriptional regulator [Actinophytocola sp.]MPZ79834.1 helix-turn-helix domain-containing protein [Actinophytocola sp.]
MDTALTGVTDEAVSRLLGEELRRARDRIGLTRAQLIARMPADIHTHTLASYESGIRQCTVVRFVEICRALGVAAPSVLGLALQRAKVELQTLTLQVDLPAVLRDDTAEFAQVRRWASNRLTQSEESEVAFLEPAAVDEMAHIFGIPRPALVDYLATFPPRSARRDADLR